MKSRVLVSVVGLPVLIVIFLWAPPGLMAAALILLTVAAAFELTRSVGVEAPLIFISVSGAAFSVLDTFLGFPDGQILPAFFVLAVFGYAVFAGGRVKFAHICAALLSVLALPYAFSAFLRIYFAGFHRAFLLLPLILSFSCDTAAFFAGCALGRHKLAPYVSPHKTVEGSAGGFAGSVLGSVCFALAMDLGLQSDLNVAGFAAMGLVCAAVAQLGDLSFSLIKREFHVKDYGHVLLGHGGVLDRFDSVIFVAPVVYILLARFVAA